MAPADYFSTATFLEEDNCGTSTQIYHDYYPEKEQSDDREEGWEDSMVEEPRRIKKGNRQRFYFSVWKVGTALSRRQRYQAKRGKWN